MRKIRVGEGEGNSSVQVEMSSLVDLSFLLLVFFIVTSTILAKERDVEMSFPREGAVLVQQGPLQLRVESDGRVLLHPGQDYEELLASQEEQHDLPLLESRLRQLMSTQRSLQIDVVDGASYQRFIDVLDSLNEVGWRNVSLVQR